MKKIVILSTGGTIASVPGHDGRNVAGALKGDALLSQVQVPDDVELQIESVFQKPSNSLTAKDLLVLAKKCQQLIDAGDTAGIVITHGTDTLEDTAYFLECVLDQADTVVTITGSQRVPYAAGTDAYVNLQHAITVAKTAECQGLGVLVVFNETILAAALTRKTSTYQLNGFSSPGFGCLGFIDGADVLLYQQARRQALLKTTATDLPRVEILTVYADSAPIALSALVDADISGVVIEGVGRGQVPPTWMPDIKRAIDKGIKVLVCSTALTGPVATSYEYPASLHDLEQLGAVGVSGLNARKARIRLMLILDLLGTNCTKEQILDLFKWGERSRAV